MASTLIDAAVTIPDGRATFFKGRHYVAFDWSISTHDKEGNEFKGRVTAGPVPIVNLCNLPFNADIGENKRLLDAALYFNGENFKDFFKKILLFKDSASYLYDPKAERPKPLEGEVSISQWNLGK